MAIEQLNTYIYTKTDQSMVNQNANACAQPDIFSYKTLPFLYPHRDISCPEDIQDILQGYGQRILINRNHLFGTQTQSRYQESRQRKIDKALSTNGIDFLYEHPIVACAIPQGESIWLAILDGHHRVRGSGRQSIQFLPSILLTLEERATIEGTTPEYEAKDLITCITETYDYFDQVMPTSVRKRPIPISNTKFIHGIEQLAA